MHDEKSSLQRILDAASAVFAEHGFAGARVDEIARRAGVNKAMLYYHVGNKHALYTVVLSRNFERMEQALGSAVDLGGSSREKVEALIQEIARILRELPDHPRIVLRELASAGSNLQPVVLERMAGLLASVRGLLGEGVHRGEFRATDPVRTYLAVIGASLMLTAAPALFDRVSEVDPGIDFSAMDAGSFLADLLINGIATSRTGEST
jgi:AcrR family transcriptional regulator